MLRGIGSPVWILFLFHSIRVNCTLVRRAFHSSVVVGDYIYIDGGEFSQMVNGNYFTNAETHTLSIPINASWSPADVNISITNKQSGAPVLNGATLWANPDGKGFYSYGGEASLGALAAPPRALWNFTVDGEGGGAWADQTDAAGEIFGSLVGTRDGASDVLGSTAYYSGGISSSRTDATEADAGDSQTKVPGLVSFDMDTGVWRNESATDAGAVLTSNGVLVHVPRFGPDGVLLALGGTIQGIDSNLSGGANAPDVSFGNISVYDPASSSWYSQTATGAIPENREKFCAVGVGAADNLSYEIFIYGGLSSAALDDQLDEVFVLSLPKFEWVKADYPATQNRYAQTCHRAGNRQMITIGGLDGATPDKDGFNITDPFPQSLGIFDLTQMEWTDSFQHDAPPYERPGPIAKLYTGTHIFPSAWDSPHLQALFNGSTTPRSQHPRLPSAPATKSSTHTHSSSKALRIGGIIACVAVGITAVSGALLLTMLWKRRKQNKKQEGSMLHAAQISRPVAVMDQIYDNSPYYPPI